MDFVDGLPCTLQGFDVIFMIIDQFTKYAHFLSVKTSYSITKLGKLYVKEIVCFHRVPYSIISDRDSKFVGHFWRSLQHAMEIELSFLLLVEFFCNKIYRSNIEMAPFEALYD